MECTGRKARGGGRIASWFPDIEKPSTGGNGTKPTPSLTTVRPDAQRLLWTVATVASDDWKSWLGPPVTINGFVNYRKTRKDRLYNSAIEVIDRERGQLVQTLKVKGFFTFFVADGFIAQYKEDDDGVLYLQLYNVSLVGKQ